MAKYNIYMNTDDAKLIADLPKNDLAVNEACGRGVRAVADGDFPRAFNLMSRLGVIGTPQCMLLLGKGFAEH